MPQKLSLNPDLLRSLLICDPEMGDLFWKSRPIEMFSGGYFSAAANCKKWNTRFAEKRAFTTMGDDGYLHGRILYDRYLAHRVIWVIVHGQWPDEIDHINGIRDDNRILNLRSVTRAENTKNLRRSCRNKSGVTGVCWYPPTNRWVVHIAANGRHKCVGYFPDFLDAVCARKSADNKYGFHANHGRKFLRAVH